MQICVTSVLAIVRVGHHFTEHLLSLIAIGTSNTYTAITYYEFIFSTLQVL